MIERKGELGAIDRSGTPGGALVIALHGAVANRKTWLPLARVLAAPFEVWCPDLPGHGSRSHEPFTLEASLAMIRDLIDAAGDRTIVLAGDSLGGYLALLAAAAFPTSVSAVCAGGCTWSMHGIPGRLARASDLPVAIVERIAGAARFERFARTILPHVTDAGTAAAIAAAGLRIASRSESLAQLAGIDLVDVVRAIASPIVFVNGARDRPTRAGERELVRRAANARVMLSPGTGHGVGFFDAPLFARAIAEAAAVAISSK